MSFVYNFQQNFKSFRDFQQNFLLSLKPIKFDVLNDVSMPDMVVLSHIFALGQVSSQTLNYIIQLIYIVCVILLAYIYFKKLLKYQEEVRNAKTVKNVNSSKISPLQENEEVEAGQPEQQSEVYSGQQDIEIQQQSSQQIPEKQKQKSQKDKEKEEEPQEVQKEVGVPKKILTAISILLLIINSLFQSIIEAFFALYADLRQETATGIQFLLCFATWFVGIAHVLGLKKILTEQIPKERTMVDEEGNEMEWNEATYQADIEKQNSPFKGLFKPYKSKFPWYEIGIMLLKGIQVVLTNFSLSQPYDGESQESSNKYASNVFSIICQAIPLVFIIKYKPYNYDGENKVNMFLYVFNIVETGLIAVQGSESMNDSIRTILVWIIRILFYAVPIAQFLLYKKYGPKQAYNMSSGEKETFKKLEFTAIIELGHKEDPKPIRNWLVFNEDIIDFPDVRSKIWHNYWNNSFQYLPQFSGEHQEEYNDLFQKKNFDLMVQKYPRFVNTEEYALTTQVRLVENRKIWNTIGGEKYKSALEIQNDKKYLKVRQNILMDVQYQDCHDGKRFGYLDLSHFPFIGIFIPDDQSESVENEEYKEIDRLAKLNCTDHNITVLKMKRKSFRALDQQMVYYPSIQYQSQERTVGSGRASQDYTIHGFLSHNYGKAIYGHTAITLVLVEGQGADVEQNQMQGQSQTNVGVDNQNYQNFSGFTHQLMYLNKDDVVRPNLPKVYERQQKKRSELTQEFYGKIKLLSYHFNVNVVNNKFMKEETLQQQLNIEENDKLNQMLKDPYSGNTYKQTVGLSKDPSRVYQHYFYSDVWKKNYDVKSLKKQQAILDPSMQDFIGYEHFKDRKEHESKLKKLKLKKSSAIKMFQSFFNDEVMENYYDKEKYFVKKYSEEFKKEDPVEVVATDEIIEYNKDKQTTYEVDTASDQEKNQFLAMFQKNMQELFTGLINISKNFWSQALNENLQQIRNYENKKRQTEDKIRQLEQQLQQAQQRLSQAEQQLRQAEQHYNRLPPEERSSYSSQVSNAKSQVSQIKDEIYRITQELELQREILRNIIELLKRINFNQNQYVAAKGMSGNISQGQFREYEQFVEHYAKNMYVALTAQSQQPSNYSKSQISHLNVQRQ